MILILTYLISRCLDDEVFRFPSYGVYIFTNFFARVSSHLADSSVRNRTSLTGISVS